MNNFTKYFCREQGKTPISALPLKNCTAKDTIQAAVDKSKEYLGYQIRLCNGEDEIKNDRGNTVTKWFTERDDKVYVTFRCGRQIIPLDGENSYVECDSLDDAKAFYEALLQKINEQPEQFKQFIMDWKEGNNNEA